MHQHISCGAPIFFIGEMKWGSTRSNSEQLGFFEGGDFGEHSEQLGALGAIGATRSNRSNSDYCLNSLTSSTS